METPVLARAFGVHFTFIRAQNIKCSVKKFSYGGNRSCPPSTSSNTKYATLSEYKEYPHILPGRTKILRPRTLKSVHFCGRKQKKI
ncbi:unnamed protein product [Nesidiocoris tenuis]|uniref:Uncharacterized protein n=1 Tax=Nesidiocoris tenuis TaxID=355587 RepID=A0A6H5FU50_9HEMI|nr:unnamed protein product [Nesidiocoris tenuis]